MPIIKTWLGRQGLKFLEALTQDKQEPYITVEDLFETLNSKFGSQHNNTILSLQHCKLSRQNNETAEQWMGETKNNTSRMQIQRGRQAFKRPIH